VCGRQLTSVTPTSGRSPANPSPMNRSFLSSRIRRLDSDRTQSSTDQLLVSCWSGQLLVRGNNTDRPHVLTFAQQEGHDIVCFGVVWKKGYNCFTSIDSVVKCAAINSRCKSNRCFCWETEVLDYFLLKTFTDQQRFEMKMATVDWSFYQLKE
jgi:hypothetical protein